LGRVKLTEDLDKPSICDGCKSAVAVQRSGTLCRRRGMVGRKFREQCKNREERKHDKTSRFVGGPEDVRWEGGA
jgi:hypothetical protein